jgi:hypothetical protein
MRHLAQLFALVLLFGANVLAAAAAEKQPLRVLYLARDNEENRAEAFESLLKDHFTQVAVLKRSDFQPTAAHDFDVVLLDWSQHEERGEKYPSPLGPCENWNTPTVLLGSAGHLIAGPWEVPGGSGCTCLAPFAYGLADHAIAKSPLALDLSKAIDTPTPGAWNAAIKEAQIKVLPLVDQPPHNEGSGWCTYDYEHKQAPEIEHISGGINHKTPKAGAIWRQGNLLHFGFEESPAELNANGRALLVNSIAYIANFTEDRPIVRTPSPFYSKLRLIDRDVIERAFTQQDFNWKRYLGHFVADDILSQIEKMNEEEALAWIKKVRPFIRANEQGRLTIDPEAQQFGVGPGEPEFFSRAAAAIGAGGDAESGARVLLARYAPEGPAPTSASADDWRRWWTANRDYLFFSDTGGFRWYLDPLAKKRGVPSRDLRGAARMTGR